MRIALESERGEKFALVVDPKDLLWQLLPDPADESYVCLRFIEHYQDTVFNQAQMRPLVSELQRISLKATPEALEIVDAVIDLAHRAAAEAHHYIKFYGD